MSVPTLIEPIARKDIAIKQNETFAMSLCIVERDNNGNAIVIDTSAWDVVLQVRREPSQDSPPLLTATVANGRIVTGISGPPGEQVNIQVTFTAADTASLTWFGCAGYDLLAIYPGGAQKYHMQGQANLMPAYSWEP